MKQSKFPAIELREFQKMHKHRYLIIDRRKERNGRFPHHNSQEDWLVDIALHDSYLNRLWKIPSMIIQIAEFEGPRGIPDIYIVRVDFEKLKKRIKKIGYWTFKTRSLANLRKALEDYPQGIKNNTILNRYTQSYAALRKALFLAKSSGAVLEKNGKLKLNPSVRRFIIDSLAVEVKVKSAPSALYHTWRYRTFSHKVAILIPNGILDSQEIENLGVGIMKPKGEEIQWFNFPQKLGALVKLDSIIAEESIIKALNLFNKKQNKNSKK